MRCPRSSGRSSVKAWRWRASPRTRPPWRRCSFTSPSGSCAVSEDARNALASRPHPLVELTRARLLEFAREPEAVFWVFIFPVLLALALGIAFRTKPPEKLRAAVEVGTPGGARLVEMLRTSPDLTVVALGPA